MRLATEFIGLSVRIRSVERQGESAKERRNGGTKERFESQLGIHLTLKFRVVLIRHGQQRAELEERSALLLPLP